MASVSTLKKEKRAAETCWIQVGNRCVAEHVERGDACVEQHEQHRRARRKTSASEPLARGDEILPEPHRHAVRDDHLILDYAVRGCRAPLCVFRALLFSVAGAREKAVRSSSVAIACSWR